MNRVTSLDRETEAQGSEGVHLGVPSGAEAEWEPLPRLWALRLVPLALGAKQVEGKLVPLLWPLGCGC